MSYLRTIVVNILVLALALEAGAAIFSYVVYDETYVARGLDMPFFHFIQPNQYVEGSKPLTDEEMRVAVTEWNEDRGRRVRAYYPHLRRTSAALRAEGIPSHDLTMLFETAPRTLYTDSCCHVNVIGRRLIAEAIGETIVASGALERVPPASERERGLLN